MKGVGIAVVFSVLLLTLANGITVTLTPSGASDLGLFACSVNGSSVGGSEAYNVSSVVGWKYTVYADIDDFYGDGIVMDVAYVRTCDYTCGLTGHHTLGSTGQVRVTQTSTSQFQIFPSFYTQDCDSKVGAVDVCNFNIPCNPLSWDDGPLSINVTVFL